MKKILALVLTSAMLIAPAGAYTVQGGYMQVAPSVLFSDINTRLDTLDYTVLTQAGATESSVSAAAGSKITFYSAGTGSQTRQVSVRLDLTDESAALADAQTFGAICGALMTLASPNMSFNTASAALDLDDTATQGIRPYYQDGVLYYYEVTKTSARFTALAYPEQGNDIALLVNDSFLALDSSPVIVNGRTMVPARGIFEHIGAEVDWEPISQTVTASGGGTNISLRIGQTTATVNGTQHTLDAAPFIQNSRTYVPIRFMAEALGAQVEWNNNPRTVLISAQ